MLNLNRGVFPLEKILSTSATEYCQFRDKRLSDYEPVGVHLCVRYYASYFYISESNTVNNDNCQRAGSLWDGPATVLARYVSSETEIEVIVGYQVTPFFVNNDYQSTFVIAGTALIPKKKEKLKR